MNNFYLIDTGIKSTNKQLTKHFKECFVNLFLFKVIFTLKSYFKTFSVTMLCGDKYTKKFYDNSNIYMVGVVFKVDIDF